MSKLLIVALLCSLAGCASYVTVLKNPETGDVEKCEAEGMGIIPASMAEDRHDDCVRQLKALGYVETAQ